MTDSFCKQLLAQQLINHEDHQQMRRLLAWSLRNPFTAPGANFYLKNGPLIVQKMNRMDADWNGLSTRFHQILDQVRNEQIPQAAADYGQILLEVMNRYWPGCQCPFWQASVKHHHEMKRRLQEGRDVLHAWPDCSDGPQPSG
jgi:hypothetical protein